MLKNIPIDQIGAKKGVRARLGDVPESYTERCINDQAILEPSFCRKIGDTPERYELASTPRPWLAAQICQYDTIPVFILSPDYANYQPYIGNAVMNPIEVAELNNKLKTAKGLSVSKLARQLGINRSALAHSLRLLKLAEPIKEKVRKGSITAGYARRFASFDHNTQLTLFRRYSTTHPQMTVRALEKALREFKKDPASLNQQPDSARKDPSLIRLEQLMSENLGSQVKVYQDHLTINFGGNLDVFDGILKKFGISASSF